MQKHISSMKVKMIPTKKLAIFPAAFCVLIFASSHNASATPLPLPPVINLASAIQGNINFAGSVQFDTQSLATATTVVTWFDVFHNAGFSNVTGGATGAFSSIAPGSQATMAQPWTF